MHYWGDEWFQENGKDLDTAIWMVSDFWLKWGRIRSNGKEKYGTFRENAYFWNGGLHELIWPGYARIMNDFIYWTLDEKILKPLMRYSGLLWIARRYQFFIYNLGIQLACKKYPHLTDELVSDLNHSDLIKPGLFGKVCGITIRDKYWETL